MKTFTHSAFVVLFSMAIAFTLIACGESSTKPEVDEPVSSSSTDALSSVTNIDPVSSSTIIDPFSSSSVIDPLSSSSVKDSSTPLAEGSFTDSRDGKSYKLVKIGSQVWMAENLHYADSLTYDFKDAQSVCPAEFHLPNMEEFQELIDKVGGTDVAAKALKSKTAWPNGTFGDWNGTDEFGFNAIPIDSGNGNGTDENYWTSDIDFHTSSTGMMMKINPYPDSKFSCYDKKNPYEGRKSPDLACFINGEPETKISVRCLSDIVECGSTTYNSNTHFCQNNIVYSLCRGRKFDATKYTCRDNNLYNIATDSLYKYSWIWLNPDIHYDLMQDPRDGQYYKIVTIDTLIWMAENLNYALDGSVCFKNDSLYCDLYGRMYTPDQARNGVPQGTTDTSTIQGVCPDGWRLPTYDEFYGVSGSKPENTIYSQYIAFDTNDQFYDHLNSTGLSFILGGIHSPNDYLISQGFEWYGLNLEGGIIGSDFSINVYYHYFGGSGGIRNNESESVRCVKQ